MLEAGFLVALGLLVMLSKLSWRKKLWVISHPVQVDIIVFVGLAAMHWGTFAGVMAATVGALFCSLTLGAAKYLIGHMVGNTYFPGVFNIAHRLISEIQAERSKQ